MNAIALCVAMLTSAQGTTSEYTFKHAKAAYVLKSKWLDGLLPGMQTAKSLENPPLTGVWVYLDEKRNRLVFGSRDDSVEWMPRYCAEFDVKPLEVKLTISVSRQDWGLALSGTIQTANNQSVTFGAERLGASFDFTPHIQADGTTSMQVIMLTLPDKAKSYCAARIDSFGTVTFQVFDGKAAFIKGPKARTGEKVITPPTGEPWKPFKIEVTAQVLERKT